ARAAGDQPAVRLRLGCRRQPGERKRPAPQTGARGGGGKEGLAMKEPLQFGIFDWIEAPEKLSAADLYAHKLHLAQAADKAGFHAYLIAEHQGTPLSINAQPSV